MIKILKIAKVWRFSTWFTADTLYPSHYRCERLDPKDCWIQNPLKHRWIMQSMLMGDNIFQLTTPYLD